MKNIPTSGEDRSFAELNEHLGSFIEDVGYDHLLQTYEIDGTFFHRVQRIEDDILFVREVSRYDGGTGSDRFLDSRLVIFRLGDWFHLVFERKISYYRYYRDNEHVDFEPLTMRVIHKDHSSLIVYYKGEVLSVDGDYEAVDLWYTFRGDLFVSNEAWSSVDPSIVEFVTQGE